MALILTIENEQSLPNGAPVSVRLTEGRGIDIGRAAGAEWSLPDPTRFISGRHCEIRYRDGGYWLNDLSTNGTFLNDSTRRVQAPHRLRDGDRLAIGSYIIAVTLDETCADALAQPAAGTAVGQVTALEPPPAADIDAQIAHAIAIETAPPAPPGPAEPTPAPHDIAEARDAAAAAGKPFTMVRARGLFPAPGVSVESAAPTPPPSAVVMPPPRPTPDPVGRRGAALWEDSLEDEDRTEPPYDDFTLPRRGRAASTFDWELNRPAPADAPEDDPVAKEALAWAPAAPAPEPLAPETPAPESRRAEPATPPEPMAARLEESVPEPTPSPQPDGARPAPGAPTAEDFLRCFAKGAGVPDHIFARQNSLKVAEELGALTRLAVEDLTQLLSARFKAKRFARTSSQTMIQAFDNNPLKFAPTPEDALKIMFGPRTSGYLDARRAFQSAFADLKTHQLNTFAAMQQAVRMLVEDLDPASIEADTGKESTLASLFGGRKARLWDVFLARWQAKTLRHEDGLVDAFMLYFAQCYDQAKESK